MKVNLTIWIPNWLDRLCAWPVMLYRRRKYGYPFRRIYLGEGEWTILDQQDYSRFSHFKWHLRHGRKGNYYAVRSFKAGSGRIKLAYLHREIIEPPPGFLVDHRNLNPLDNRRDNLRPATRSQNRVNCRRDKSKTTSRFVGVHFEKARNRWVAQTHYQGKTINLGRFKNEIDAAHAYDHAARKYHGEFARLNFS
jgi:hypothetical protein